MDGIVSDDIFTLPLVLPSTNLNQAVSLINCNGWQLEVAKDQSVPFVVLKNGDFSITNASGLQNSYPIKEVSIPKIQDNEKHSSPSQEDVLQQGKDGTTDVRDPVNEGTSSQDSSENYLMDELVETLIMYKCKLCTFKSTEKSLLADHIRDVHLKVGLKKEDVSSDSQDGNEHKDAEVLESSLDRMVYMCGSCTEAFGNFTECQVHMAQHHKILMGTKPMKKVEKDVQRDRNKFYIQVNVKTDLKRSADQQQVVSNEESNNSDEETNTILDITKERNLKCPEPGCSVKFYSELGLNKHKLCHISDSSKGYSCNYCNAYFNKWPMCATHLWRIHSVDAELYSCSVCPYKTALKVKMNIHLRIHDEGKEFMCDECGKMFSQKAQLRNHGVTHLKSKPDQQPRWYTKKECDQCQKTFANSKSLKKHVQAVHSKLKPYFCQVCSHSSATKGMLLTHLRQHTGEKPFSCPTCSYTTGDHNSLRRHRMRHSGERPYSCPHCPYSSIQSSSLKHHISTWHPVRTEGAFNCEQCSFSSETEDLYLSHLASEHPETITSTSDSECMFYGDMTATQFMYQCWGDYKENKSSLQSDMVCSSSGDVTLSSREFDDENQISFSTESLGQEGIIISAEEDEKEMIIEIPISTEDMNYLKEHSIVTEGLSLPSDDIDSFQPVP